MTDFKKTVILQRENNKTIHEFEFGITGKCKQDRCIARIYMQPDAAYSFAQVAESNIPHGREIRADASHSANMA